MPRAWHTSLPLAMTWTGNYALLPTLGLPVHCLGANAWTAWTARKPPNRNSFEIVPPRWCISLYLWLLLPMFQREHPSAYFQFLLCLLAPFCIAGIPEGSAPRFLGHFRSRKAGCRRGRSDVGTHCDCSFLSCQLESFQSFFLVLYTPPRTNLNILIIRRSVAKVLTGPIVQSFEPVTWPIRSHLLYEGQCLCHIIVGLAKDHGSLLWHQRGFAASSNNCWGQVIDN